MSRLASLPVLERFREADRHVRGGRVTVTLTKSCGGSITSPVDSSNTSGTVHFLTSTTRPWSRAVLINFPAARMIAGIVHLVSSWFLIGSYQVEVCLYTVCGGGVQGGRTARAPRPAGAGVRAGSTTRTSTGLALRQQRFPQAGSLGPRPTHWELRRTGCPATGATGRVPAVQWGYLRRAVSATCQ